MEVGAFAIKAVRLEREGEVVQVTDFAVIPHKKPLSTPDLDQDEMIRLTLGQFISQHSLEGEHLVMSVPGHSAFARFAKLPPVEPKKIPDIVKFEAVQQIPFPIEDVEWDYQTFTDPDSPEVEVGIFAITRDRVQHMLGVYSELGISPERLTLSPVAVSNAVAYDHANNAQSGPVLYLDIGANATDVIVAEQGRVWIRTFPLGGTHFTEAIAGAFKLSYGKAEKLKLEASTSKYARQIMQAMRPVFSDLLQDLQRSIGYYQSTHHDSNLELMVGLGSTFRIPGLRKFLGQQLQMDVMRLDEYKRIAVTGREAASFAESAVNLASAYGLALQGVGLAPIDANLVPVKALREQMWHAKTKWFGIAAAILILAAASLLIRPMRDQGFLKNQLDSVVSNTIENGKRLKDEFSKAERKYSQIGHKATNMMSLLDHREIFSWLVSDTALALETDPQSELLGDNVLAILEIDPKDRRLIELESLNVDYVPPEGDEKRRLLSVTMQVKLSHDRPDVFLNRHVAKWLRDHAEPEGDRANAPYRILIDSISCNPTEREDFVIGEEGKESSPRGGSGRPSGTRPPRSGRPSAPTTPPGEMGGGRLAGPGGIVAPGKGSKSGSTSNSGTSNPPPSSNPRGGSRGGGSRGGGFGGDSNQDDHGTEDVGFPDFNLDEVAPVPDAPRYYPSGAKFFRVPITFVVEILTPRKDAGGESTASAAFSQNEGEAS